MVFGSPLRRLSSSDAFELVLLVDRECYNLKTPRNQRPRLQTFASSWCRNNSLQGHSIKWLISRKGIGCRQTNSFCWFRQLDWQERPHRRAVLPHARAARP